MALHREMVSGVATGTERAPRERVGGLHADVRLTERAAARTQNHDGEARGDARYVLGVGEALVGLGFLAGAIIFGKGAGATLFSRKKKLGLALMLCGGAIAGATAFFYGATLTSIFSILGTTLMTLGGAATAAAVIFAYFAYQFWQRGRRASARNAARRG